MYEAQRYNCRNKRHEVDCGINEKGRPFASVCDLQHFIVRSQRGILRISEVLHPLIRLLCRVKFLFPLGWRDSSRNCSLFLISVQFSYLLPLPGLLSRTSGDGEISKRSRRNASWSGGDSADGIFRKPPFLTVFINNVRLHDAP